MTQEDLLRIREAMDKAQDDTTPFKVIKDDQIAVVGDPNNTEVKKFDYKITFVFPDPHDMSVIREHEMEFKNVWVTPRQNPRIVALVTKLMPYFRKALPDGTVGEYTPQEANEIIANMEDEILDLMYKLVGSVLKVDKDLWDNMRLDSVLQAFLQILNNMPELANEADTSFQGNSGPIGRTF